MFKLINWKFNDLKCTELAIGEHVFLSIGQWDKLQFDIVGLGLNKFERELFETGFLEIRNVVNVYLGFFLISFNRNGLEDHFRGVKVVKTQLVGDLLKQKLTRLHKKIKIKYHDFLDKRQFKQLYEFQIDKYYEGTYRFKADLLSAFQLASNYEADLIWNGRFILSPLGFSYEENRDLIETYLGKRFLTKSGGFNLREYRHDYDPQIREYKRIA